jgi:hypothetical protein
MMPRTKTQLLIKCVKGPDIIRTDSAYLHRTMNYQDRDLIGGLLTLFGDDIGN